MKHPTLARAEGAMGCSSTMGTAKGRASTAQAPPP